MFSCLSRSAKGDGSLKGLPKELAGFAYDTSLISLVVNIAAIRY